jgi:hypothetical protein
LQDVGSGFSLTYTTRRVHAVTRENRRLRTLVRRRDELPRKTRPPPCAFDPRVDLDSFSMRLKQGAQGLVVIAPAITIDAAGRLRRAFTRSSRGEFDAPPPERPQPAVTIEWRTENIPPQIDPTAMQVLIAADVRASTGSRMTQT